MIKDGILVVIAAGWRHYKDPLLPVRAADRLLEYTEGQMPLELIHGAAPGLDSILRDWCVAQRRIGHDVTHKPYPADWHIWGKRAGFIRNAHMWAMNWHRVDLCLAFPGPPGQSPGTANCVEHAHMHSAPVWLVPFGATDLPPIPPLLTAAFNDT